ncbi:MAG TPA: GNAT family N-acetyltransferase [Bacteroidia bacterium]|nr:GNAT family N-acetyltransferase [Bacteroidia bacterium]HRB26000.1 GNAT family N-acetyltransferase [Bacteroidia bacterium]HRB53190.1 GNAT family N-acetyltransferase [Bacteroidia bacterium]HRB87222.1 GNAT family N-acetyltransferase [Bacteroidia bacterium]
MNVLSEFIQQESGQKIIIAHPESEEELNQYYQLRHEILRAPWNQPPGSEKVNDDNEAIHLSLLIDDLMIGVCRLHFNNADEAQIRFMGVKSEFRNQKLGDYLMVAAENISKSNHCKSIFLQARVNAVPFYERNGYHIEAKTFLLFDTIQHYAMRKNI